MTSEAGLRGRWSESRPSKTTLFWACVASAIAPVAIGFFWGGWVTAGESARISREAADKARTELAAEVCAGRFVSAPDAATQLAKLRNTDPWARADLLQQDGWTTLPGMRKEANDELSDSEIGDLCAQRLMTATLPTQHAEARR